MSNGYGVIKKNNHSVRQKTLRRFGVAAAVAACFGMGFAQANPTNPVVANGAAQFTTAGNLLTVINTPNAIINWGSFSIGANEITRFMQQSSASAVLNRVGAGRDPSSILGALQSNGRVFLINPNGITFGAGSQINVAGLVASTLNLSDADFLAGRMRFTDGLGNSLINNGNITTGTGGSVYLVGNAVTNNGIITSPKGEVVLAAGSSVELVNPGTPDLRVEIVAPDNQAVNLGQIVADSGRVGIYAGLINHSGTINANSVGVDAAGNITLRATKNIDLAAGSSITANGPSGGVVTVQSGDTTLAAGTIEAKGSAGQGGSINLLGNLVGLTGNTSIDASGQTGGGTVLVGGDYQGKNAAIQNAFRTYVGADATIKADAITSGDGGKVIVWGNDATRAYGSISARGGAQSGNGGFVETSSRYLDVTRAPDISAPNGSGGTWLLDPDNIDISAGVNSNITGVSPFGPAVAGPSVLNIGILNAALDAGGTVVVDTTSGGVGVGDINVNAAISTTGISTLTLKAHRDINVSNPISGANLGLVLTPDQDSNGSGVANISANIGIGGPITVNGGGRVQFGGNPTISASLFNIGSDISIDAGTATLNVDTNATGGLQITGGVITGTGNFSFGIGSTGNNAWSGGTIAGTGTLTTNADTNNITGPVTMQRNWNADNSFSISGTGSLNIAGSATVTVGNSVNIASTAPQQIFGTGSLVNDGTIAIQAGVPSVNIASAGFTNNSGSTVQVGVSGVHTVTINGSGSDAATYDFGTAGGVLDFSGGTRTFTGGSINATVPGSIVRVSGATVTVPSTTGFATPSLQVTGGALTVNRAANLTLANASFTGGTTTFNGSQIDFTGPFSVGPGATLTGTSNFNTGSTLSLNWSGGTVSGAGALTTDIGAVSVSGPVTLQRNWVNNTATTVTISGASGGVTIGPGATITNDGTFSITSGAAAPLAGSGTFLNRNQLSENVASPVSIQSVFNNQGTLTIGGGGTTTLGAATLNDGATYQVPAGNTLAFNGNRTFVGGGVTNPVSGLGGNAQFLGGTVTFTGTALYNPDGNTTINNGASVIFNNGATTFSGGLNLLSGTLGGSANLTVPGTALFNWTTGTLAAGGLLTTNSASTISGVGTLQRNWQSNNLVTISPAGTLNLNGGSLTASSLNVDGLLKGNGTITITGSGASAVTNNGTVAPGASPGSINIVGNYVQTAAGILQIELGGTTAGSTYDQLTVSGTAALNGTLVITQFGTFAALPANTFNIISAGAVSGTFSTVVVPAVFTGLGAGYQSTLVQLAGAIGPFVSGSSSVTALDPFLVREDKNIFDQVEDDADVFKRQDYLVCS